MRVASSILTTICITGHTAAQATFGPPEPITAGESTFSEFLYPSPVLFDVEGDSKRELVIGDLFGALQSCQPVDSEGGLVWAALKPLQCDGQPLRLHNW